MSGDQLTALTCTVEGHILKWTVDDGWVCGADSEGEDGTVTSVGLSLPASVFDVTVSPITTTGNLTAGFKGQTQNTVFAAPVGGDGTPSFRALEASDIPGLDASHITAGELPIARGGTGRASFSNNAILVTDASGDLTAGVTCADAGHVLSWDGTNWVCVADDTGIDSKWEQEADNSINRMVGSVGIGTDAPKARLDVAGGIRVADDGDACVADKYGTIRYNGGVLQYCNTTNNWVSLGVAGSGLQSLNGLTENDQDLAVSTATTALAPRWNSVTDTHTLEIPMASSADVTAGLISKADYDDFSGKQDALGFTPVDIDGDTMTGFLELHAAPTDAMHAATKQYVDGHLAGQTLTAPTTAQNGQALVWNDDDSEWQYSALSAGSVTEITAGTGLDGGTITSTGTISIADGGVDTTQLADAAVTTAKIEDAAVTTDKLADGSVTTAKLDDNSVSTDKIIDEAVIGVKIADEAISTAHIFAPVANQVRIVATDGGLTGNQLVPLTCDEGEVLKWTTATGWDCDDAGGGGDFMADGSVAMTGPIRQAGGTNTAPSYTFAGDTNTGMYSSVADTIQFTAGNFERMRITSSGNVGISVTNPQTRLDVSGGIRVANEIKDCDANLFGTIRYSGSVLQYCKWPGTWVTVGTASGDFMADGSVPMTDQLVHHVGSVAEPSITFSGRTNTGIFSGGANSINFTTGGNNAGYIGLNEFELYRPIRAINGGTPTNVDFGFVGDHNTGMYRSAADTLQFSTGGTERLRINSTGDIGIGASNPRAKLDVNGPIVSAPAGNVAAGTVNFGTANIMYTTQSCRAFNLHNMKNGGTYSLIIQGTTSATCSFTAYSDAGSSSLTVRMPPDHTATIATKETLYTFMVVGSRVYVTWIPGY